MLPQARGTNDPRRNRPGSTPPKRAKMVAAAAAIALGVGIASAPPTSASTARTGAVSISVSDTTVYTTSACADYPFTLRVDVPEGVSWQADVNISRPGSWGAYESISATGPATRPGDAYLCPRLDGYGQFHYEATLHYSVDRYVDGTRVGSDDRTDVATATSTVKAPASVTLDASPEPVEKGSTLKVRGKVTYRNAAWVATAVKDQDVIVQFLPSSEEKWTAVGRVRTSSRGYYSLKATARTDGSYRTVFAGTSTINQATSASDYVDAR